MQDEGITPSTNSLRNGTLGSQETKRKKPIDTLIRQSFFPLLAALLLHTSLCSLLCAEAPSHDLSYLIIDFEESKIREYEDEQGFLAYPFPPGSIIKLFSTLAYLKNGGEASKILQCKETTIDAPIPPACWYRPGHGYIDLISAISNSCDAYFSKIFTEDNFAELISLLWECKLIDNYEYTYLKDIPVAEKRKTWSGIGKHLIIPPEELFIGVYTIASRGYLYRRSDSLLIFQAPLPINDEFIHTVREGMRESSISGTTKHAQEVLGMRKVFAKTGTATYYYNKEDYTKTHGYFICFYPYPEPQYGILVFMLDGDGKTASKKGALLFKDFLDRHENGSKIEH